MTFLFALKMFTNVINQYNQAIKQHYQKNTTDLKTANKRPITYLQHAHFTAQQLKST